MPLNLDVIGRGFEIDAYLGRTAFFVRLHEIFLVILFAAYGMMGLWAFGMDAPRYRSYPRAQGLTMCEEGKALVSLPNDAAGSSW